MSQHCEEPGCSLPTLEGGSQIGNYVALFDVVTYTFSQYDQSRPPCISSGAVGMMICKCVFKDSFNHQIAFFSKHIP